MMNFRAWFIMNKISSGIPGLDEILGGGLPESSIILLSGTCGAGKTVLGMQFLVSSPEPAIYVSFEEDMESVKENFGLFGWDVDKLENSNKLRLLQYDPFRLEDVLEVIQNNMREMGARRIVFDSVSALGTYMKDVAELRRMILQIGKLMKKSKCTALLISETLPNTNTLSRFGVEEFVADGVISLDTTSTGNELRRAITVWKMRGMNHSSKAHPYTITGRGISAAKSRTFHK